MACPGNRGCLKCEMQSDLMKLQGMSTGDGEKKKERKKTDNKPPSDLLPPFLGCPGSLRFLFGAGEVTAIGGLCDFHGQLLRRRQRQAPLAGENQSAWQTSPTVMLQERIHGASRTYSMLKFQKMNMRFIDRSRTPSPRFLHSAWMCIINVIISYT